MYVSDHIVTSKHYLVHFVCAFAAGIYFAVRFGIIITSAIILFSLILALLLGISLKTLNLFKKKYIILSVVLAFAAALGVFRIYCADYIQSSYLRSCQGKEVWLCGTVASDPHITSSGHYYTFELEVFGIADKTGNFGTIMMYTPRSLYRELDAGDNIYAWTALKSPDNQASSLHFDFQTHLRGKNIFLTGTARNINHLPQNIRLSPIAVLKSSGALLRGTIGHSIDMLFPDNKTFNAILKGILIGDKSGFDDDLYQKFLYSGISHIVAVSGLHISILFSFLMIASTKFHLNKRLNLLISIPFILLLMSASGFTPSVCRAAIMVIIMICSTLFGEEYNPVTSLFLAIGLILASAPYALFSKSLVLSFFATFGIFVYFPYIYDIFLRAVNLPMLRLKRHKPIKKCFLYLSSSVALSLSSFIGTAYFLVLFFGAVSKVQFLTNLWVIPLVSVVFCLGYICCILHYICPWLATFLKYPLAWCLEIIKFTVDKFGTPANALSISSVNLNGITAIIYFGTAFMFYMLLKAFRDIITEREIKNKKAS